MRSVKLVLMLIIFGVAFIVAAVVPSDMDGTAHSSVLGSWVMGLLGAGSLLWGLLLLRKGYVAAQQARGGAPLPTSARALLAFCAATVVAAFAFAVFHAPSHRESSSEVRSPGAMTKEDYVAQEQKEIRRRQGTDKPAPAPNAPDGALK